MCKYCDQLKDKGAYKFQGYRLANIRNQNLKCGFLGELDFDLQISSDDEHYYLQSVIMHQEADLPVKKLRARINYCPFCGRKFEEVMK